MGSLVKPANIATSNALRRALLWLTGSTLLVAAILATDWQHHRILLQRFWMPLSAVSATHVSSATGNVVLPRGESIDIVLAVTGLPRDTARLELLRDEGQRELIELAPDAENAGRYTHHLPALEASLQYRGVSGDG